MLRWAVYGMAALLFVGCASKQEKELEHMYKQKKLYHKTLLKTEKALFKNGNGVSELAVVATYLNTDRLDKVQLREEDENMIASFFGIFKPEDKTQTRHTPERFIVGFYSDMIDTDRLAFYGVKMTLNGKKPLRMVRLPHHDKRLKRLSFVTRWGTYYLVSFPHQRAEKLRLTVSFNADEKEMSFSKRAKYLYTKKAFD